MRLETPPGRPIASCTNATPSTFRATFVAGCIIGSSVGSGGRQTTYDRLKEPERGGTKSTPRASKLGPYKKYLRSRLEQFRLSTTVLLRGLARATTADWLDGSVHILAKTRELPCTEITDQVLEQVRRKAG